MANRFSLSNPEDMAKIEAHLDMLPVRRLKNIDALHYVKTKDYVKCLDFDLTASSIEELNVKVRNFCDSFPPADVPDFAHRNEWLAAVGPNKSETVFTIFLPIRKFLVTVCEPEA